MAEIQSIREQVRFRRMKVMKAEGLSYAEMVPKLHELGLIECRNCEAGTPTKRVTKSGEEICTTCEDTIQTFFRRNLESLTWREAELLELRWEWFAVKRQIARKCITRGDTADLRLASEIMNELARFVGIDLEMPEGEGEGADNERSGSLVIRRPAGRRETDRPN